MQGVYLKFFVCQSHKHHSVLVYEWLLEQAKKKGYPGGSAFLSLASFGQSHRLHEGHFFELGSDLSVEVSFALSDAQASEFLLFLKKENVNLFYTKSPIDFGFTKDITPP